MTSKEQDESTETTVGYFLMIIFLSIAIAIGSVIIAAGAGAAYRIFLLIAGGL